MDPLTIIVTALVAGAAAATQDVAAQAVKDGYAALKALIIRKFGAKTDVQSAIAQTESKPASEARKAVLKEELEAGGAREDKDVLHQAEALLKLLEERGLIGKGGPRTVIAGPRGIAVGGDATGSTLNTGDHTSLGKQSDVVS